MTGPATRPAKIDRDDAPNLETPNWDDIQSGSLVEDNAISRDEPTGELPDEDDDNPDQESDEALPDDLEEQVLGRDPSREGARFGET